jgi:ubiquinone/menaquinone biosynthesis C-methylase UbiE
MTSHTSWQEIYEQHLVPAIFGPWSKRTVALANPEKGDSVLDVACGTGVVTRLVAQHVGTHGHVFGLDANAGMIEVARTYPVLTDISIDWQVGDALSLPFSSAMFHLVICQGGLQFFPDRLIALREMHRVLKTGGKVVLMVCQQLKYCPGFRVLIDRLASHVGWQIASVLRIPFTLGDAEECYELITDAGFQDVTIHPVVEMVHFTSPTEFVQSLITGSSIASQVDKAVIERLAAELSMEMQPFMKNGALSFPMGGYLATAYK